MIVPNKTRLDEFDNAIEHSKIVHRGYLDTEKETQTQNF